MALSLTTSLLLAATLLLLLLSSSEARDFLVGGTTDAWKVPSSPSESLNRWAEANRFQVGDSLVWKYDSGKDSVLQVTREDYLSCRTSASISESRGGNTTVRLDRAGAYYFVSGAEGACQKGQKVIVVVMSPNRRFSGASSAPASAPAEAESPAAAPVAGGAAVVVGGLGRVVMAGIMVALGFMAL